MAHDDEQFVYDPFQPSHPILNHRLVSVTAYVAGEVRVVRDVSWNRLTFEERLQLERLLAKACAS